MAEMLAASARQSAQAASAHTQNSSQKPLRQGQESAGAIPARLEEALDIEGEIPIQEVEVAGTVSALSLLGNKARRCVVCVCLLTHHLFSRDKFNRLSSRF